MLGLFNGTMWENNVVSLGEPPGYWDTLVGWWDFTVTANNLYEEPDSGTSYITTITSDGDPIGRCKNKARKFQSRELGKFIRATSDNNRPTFKTGGANGHSYAEFDNSSYVQALVCRSTDTGWGAISTDKLSATRLKAEDLSIFIVGEPLDDDTDGDEEHIFSYFGYYAGEGYPEFDSDDYIRFTYKRDDDDDHHASWTLGDSDAAVSPNTINATEPQWHFNSGSASIINIQTAPIAGGANIYTNNLPDIDQTIFHPDSPSISAQHNWCDFDPVDYDDSLTASIGIGGLVSSTGVINTNSFEGKIYEILVYKEALSEIDRSLLTYYLGYKYDINITT